MGRRKGVERVRVRRGSDNVFADLGLPNADELLAKATLASAITEAVTARGLTQRAAAQLMGIDQPKVSRILSGRLKEFSTERLITLLRALGRDILIVVRPTPKSRKRGRLSVAA